MIRFSKGKIDKVTEILGWISDLEVDEINSVIKSVKTKLTTSSYSFSYRELSEIKTGLMWLLTKDINNSDISSVLGKVSEILFEMDED